MQCVAKTKPRLAAAPPLCLHCPPACLHVCWRHSSRWTAVFNSLVRHVGCKLSIFLQKHLPLRISLQQVEGDALLCRHGG